MADRPTDTIVVPLRGIPILGALEVRICRPDGEVLFVVPLPCEHPQERTMAIKITRERLTTDEGTLAGALRGGRRDG
jgi:hypothetical protein